MKFQALDAPILDETFYVIPDVQLPGLSGEIREDKILVYPPGSPEPTTIPTYCIVYGALNTCSSLSEPFLYLYDQDVLDGFDGLRVTVNYAVIYYCVSYWTVERCEQAVGPDNGTPAKIVIEEAP